MMKFLPQIALVSALIVGGLTVYVNEANALEQTIMVEGTNYVSLQQMAKKYNLAIEDNSGSIKLVGEAVNLEIPVGSSSFSLNGENFQAQKNSITKDKQTWITAKDWAELFGLSLTHYDKVSQMNPVSSEPVTTNVDVDKTTYKVSDSWGNELPNGVREHGNIDKIKTPVIEFSIYEKEHNNEVLESEYELQTPWQE